MQLLLYIYQMVHSDVDIFCLQEVWGSDVQGKIRTDLKPFYPHALSAIDLDTEPTDTTTPACGDDSGLDEYFACRAQRCADQSGLAFSFCGIIRFIYTLQSVVIYHARGLFC